jgi:hypothetical protein
MAAASADIYKPWKLDTICKPTEDADMAMILDMCFVLVVGMLLIKWDICWVLHAI